MARVCCAASRTGEGDGAVGAVLLSEQATAPGAGVLLGGAADRQATRAQHVLADRVVLALLWAV